MQVRWGISQAALRIFSGPWARRSSSQVGTLASELRCLVQLPRCAASVLAAESCMAKFHRKHRVR